MSIRFRRSIRLAPGVKINLTKTGLGLTLGPRGAHYSIHSSGRRTRTLGLPGTGLYAQSQTGGGRPRPARARVQYVRPPMPAPPLSVEQAIPHPGLFASGAEKAYHAGVIAYVRGDAIGCLAQFDDVLTADPSVTSAHLFAGAAAITVGHRDRAIIHLQAVVESRRPLPDALETKYLVRAGVALKLGVRITDAVMGYPPFSEFGAALALAELYQTAGRLSEAIGLVHQVHTVVPNPLVRLSLCDLLFADRDYDGVVEASTGVLNDSDVGLETLHLRAAAFVASGLDTAAMETFRLALAKTAGREVALLNAVRYDRALVYERLGQRARAKADLERVYALDPDFEDVKARLAAL